MNDARVFIDFFSNGCEEGERRRRKQVVVSVVALFSFQVFAFSVASERLNEVECEPLLLSRRSLATPSLVPNRADQALILTRFGSSRGEFLSFSLANLIASRLMNCAAAAAEHSDSCGSAGEKTGPKRSQVSPALASNANWTRSARRVISAKKSR